MADSPIALRNTLRRLADWEAPELAVISAYLDLRPMGEDPNVRPGTVVLRDRLREIERSFQPHTSAYDDFQAEAERINTFVEQQPPEAAGLAIFAGAGLGFETAETRVDLDSCVAIGPQPALLGLARLADHEQSVVAMADTNTLRLFVYRSGMLEEAGLVDDETDDYVMTEKGGWSQSRFQRHVQEHRDAFARLAAEAIEDVVNLEDAKVLLLAGDEVALPTLRQQLPERLERLVRGTFRIEMRAGIKEIEAEVLPMLDAIRAEDATDAADRLVGAAKADAMAVGGFLATRNALELGQALELILDAQEPDEGDAELEELVRMAAATDARVRFVADHEGLRSFGGVGALLRFRLDRPADDPTAGVHELAGKATL